MVFEEEEPEATPVDPLVAQFGEGDGWYRNILDFVRQEEEGGAMDPLDFWRAQIPRDEVQVSGPHRDASWLEYATATLASRG